MGVVGGRGSRIRFLGALNAVDDDDDLKRLRTGRFTGVVNDSATVIFRCTKKLEK